MICKKKRKKDSYIIQICVMIKPFIYVWLEEGLGLLRFCIVMAYAKCATLIARLLLFFSLINDMFFFHLGSTATILGALIRLLYQTLGIWEKEKGEAKPWIYELRGRKWWNGVVWDDTVDGLKVLGFGEIGWEDDPQMQTKLSHESIEEREVFQPKKHSVNFLLFLGIYGIKDKNG